MTDADASYLARIAEDCRSLLGPDIRLDLELTETGRSVRLVGHLELGEHKLDSVGTGATLLAAHADLRRRLVEDRIGLALRALVAAG